MKVNQGLGFFSTWRTLSHSQGKIKKIYRTRLIKGPPTNADINDPALHHVQINLFCRGQV